MLNDDWSEAKNIEVENKLFGVSVNREDSKLKKEIKDLNNNLKISDTLTFENADDVTIKKFIKQFIDEDTQDDNMNLIIEECMNNLSHLNGISYLADPTRLNIGIVNDKIISFIDSYIRTNEDKEGDKITAMGYTVGHDYMNKERSLLRIISVYRYYITLDKIHNGLELKVYIGDKEGIINKAFSLYKKEEINSLLESLFEMIKNVLKVRQESETLLDDFFGEI